MPDRETTLFDFLLSSFDSAQQKINWTVALIAGLASATASNWNVALAVVGAVVTIILGLLNSVLTVIKIRKEMRE